VGAIEQGQRFKAFEQCQQIAGIAEVMRVDLVAVTVEDPRVARDFAARGQGLFDWQTPGRQHGDMKGARRAQHAAHFVQGAAQDGFVAVIDHIPCQHVVEGGIGKGQVCHRGKLGGDRQARRFGEGRDGAHGLFRRIDGVHHHAHPRQGQGVPPNPCPQIQHPCTFGQGFGMGDHIGFRLGPGRLRIGLLPLGIPIKMGAVGFHGLSVQISLDRIQLDPCSTAITRISSIRMMVKASS
jgi:hypothetical protein